MSRRMEKVNELLQQELSQIIEKEIKKEKDFFVTVQEVQTSANLKTAKVLVSIFDTKISTKEQEEIISELQKESFGFQKILSNRLDLKFIPRLTFELDISGEVLQKIDQLIEDSKKDLKKDSKKKK